MLTNQFAKHTCWNLNWGSTLIGVIGERSNDCLVARRYIWTWIAFYDVSLIIRAKDSIITWPAYLTNNLVQVRALSNIDWECWAALCHTVVTKQGWCCLGAWGLFKIYHWVTLVRSQKATRHTFGLAGDCINKAIVNADWKDRQDQCES